MSKSDISMRECWEEYPFKIQMLAEKPKNNGILTEEDAEKLNSELSVIDYGSERTGARIVLYWAIDREEGRVTACRYTLFGSPAHRAAADMAALLCRNKTPEEISKIDYKTLEYFLRDRPDRPALPDSKRYVVTFVLEALSVASNMVMGVEREESPVVCKCSGTRLDDLKRYIREFGIKSIGEIGDYTSAGRFCKMCISSSYGKEREYYLDEILDSVRKEMQEESGGDSSVSDKPFREMDIEEKKRAIEVAIDQYIRAMLVMDGGDMEILDVKENGNNTDIYIRYLGACSGCASASTGTLFAIEGILKQKLDPDIRVLPL
jgi:NifU-like protein